MGSCHSLKNLWLIACALFLMALVLAACSTQGQIPLSSPPAPRSTSSIQFNIGVDKTSPPFVSANAANDLVGFDIELMKTLAVRAGFEIKFFVVGFNRLIPGVSTCQYDAGLSALSITDALKQQVLFSDPYLEVRQVLVVKKGNVEITGRDRLAGMTIGALENSAGERAVTAIPGAVLKSYPTYDVAYQALIGAMIDAIISDQPQAQAYIDEKANNLKLVGSAEGSQGYGIAVCAKRPELLKMLNSGIAALKADGTLDKLSKKWLGSSVTR